MSGPRKDNSKNDPLLRLLFFSGFGAVVVAMIFTVFDVAADPPTPTTPTDTPTSTPTPSPVASSTPTNSPTGTLTATLTPTLTPTGTPTDTPTSAPRPACHPLALLASSTVVCVERASTPAGSTAQVRLRALNIADSRLGAWTVDISYDRDLLTPLACTAQQVGVCNVSYRDRTVRVSGASADGLAGDVTLGSITFLCSSEGDSVLTVSLSVFADATFGGPELLNPSISHGSITCSGE